MSAPKTLLIVPPGGYYAERWSKGQLMPPLGIGYVAGSLEAAGLPVEILDAHLLRLSPQEITRELQSRKPDVVGVTFTTETRFEGFATLRLARASLPDALVVAGGPHASLAAEDLLACVGEVDVVVLGEGEETMVDLVRARADRSDLAEVPGLALRRDGQVLRGPPRGPIRDLDALPLPARHLYPPLDRYNFIFDVPGQGEKRFGNLMTSRGCPFQCNFCATPKMWGTKVRMRSAEAIAEEVNELATRYGAEALWIFDDTFNTSPRRVTQFCDELDRRSLHLPWFCEVRVDRMSRDLLLRMKEAGCYTIGFGVESGSQRILDEVIGKGLDLDAVQNVLDWSEEIGVIANPFFIFSHPTETWEEAQETLRLIRENRHRIEASMALLHIYPGTRLEEIAYQNGSLPQGFSWCNPDQKGVRTLPTAQGNVPIFVDQLSWQQIGELLFTWAEMREGGYRIWNKIPKALGSIRSWDDLKRYGSLGMAYLKTKARK